MDYQDVEDLKTSDQKQETMMRLETKIDTVTTAMEAMKTSHQHQEKMTEDNIYTRGMWCGHGGVVDVSCGLCSYAPHQNQVL